MLVLLLCKYLLFPPCQESRLQRVPPLLAGAPSVRPGAALGGNSWRTGSLCCRGPGASLRCGSRTGRRRSCRQHRRPRNQDTTKHLIQQIRCIMIVIMTEIVIVASTGTVSLVLTMSGKAILISPTYTCIHIGNCNDTDDSLFKHFLPSSTTLRSRLNEHPAGWQTQAVVTKRNHTPVLGMPEIQLCVILLVDSLIIRCWTLYCKSTQSC